MVDDTTERTSPSLMARGVLRPGAGRAAARVRRAAGAGVGGRCGGRCVAACADAPGPHERAARRRAAPAPRRAAARRALH